MGVSGRWRSSLFAWVEQERGRESWAEGTNERGGGARRARGSNGARGLGRGRRTRGRGRVHGGEIVGGMLGAADRWGRRNREREGAGEKNGVDSSAPQSSERERERSERAGWRRQAGPACQTHGARGRGRAWGLGLLGWLGPKWPFPFS
jgi:hypothetical protein